MDFIGEDSYVATSGCEDSVADESEIWPDGYDAGVVAISVATQAWAYGSPDVSTCEPNVSVSFKRSAPLRNASQLRRLESAEWLRLKPKRRLMSLRLNRS